MSYIRGVAMPGLRWGKLPPAGDQDKLFGPDMVQLGSSGPGRRGMDAWAALHKKDPRSQRTALHGLDEARQRLILEWVSSQAEASSAGAYVPPVAAPRGSPAVYRLGERDGLPDYVGCTLYSLARDGEWKRLKPLAKVPAGQSLAWLTGSKFKWRFPDHLNLFMEIQTLDQNGCTTEANEGTIRISSQFARQAYTKC
jgi:hypothetical protein